MERLSMIKCVAKVACRVSFVALFATLPICACSRTSADPPPVYVVSDASSYTQSRLSSPEIAVLQDIERNVTAKDMEGAVLVYHDGRMYPEKATLMYVVFRNVLIVVLADPHNPQGITPGCGGTCKIGWGIVGGLNISYMPQPTKLLPTGSRIIASPGGTPLTRLDLVARAAYSREHVTPPWGTPFGYWR